MANIERKETRTEFWRRKDNEVSLTEDLGVDGVKILKRVLKKKDRLNWIHLNKDRYKWSFL
jgi:hypothetical protein